ncbi:MAG: NAD(P)/FAD-dependent oxidoreductase, partial [Eubacteriales bacterium]
KGVSYCAVCDGAFYKGKPVAVVGGGSTALQDAIFLSAYCSSVTLIHRRDEFRGEERLVKTLQTKGNVSFILNSTVKSLDGASRIEGVTVTDKITGAETKIPVDGVFVAVGQMPRNEKFANIVTLDDYGYIASGEDCRTSTDGVFAAGDCRTKTLRQLTTAAADGAVAGTAAAEYCD